MTKRTVAERLLADVRNNPSRTCFDPKQLDLIDHVVEQQTRKGFAALDAAIAKTLAEDADRETPASTLPEDGRSEVPLDDPTSENDVDDIPSFLDRRGRL